MPSSRSANPSRLRLIADTNIIVSALLTSGQIRTLLFSPRLRLFSPSYLKEELLEHRAEFCKKMGIKAGAYSKAVAAIISQIEIIPLEKYLPFEVEARSASPDADDWPFFAAVLFLGCPIWSNDKRMKNQNKAQVIDTAQLLEILKKAEVK